MVFLQPKNGIEKLHTSTEPINVSATLQQRPCTFGQSLGWPIVRSISHFFGWPKKKLSSLRDPTKKFWSVSDFFVHPLERLTKKNNSETDQIFFVRSLRLDNFFFGRPKKWEIDWTIGQPTDWPKVHGRRLLLYPCSHFYFDINFCNRLYSKEKRPGSPVLFLI